MKQSTIYNYQFYVFFGLALLLTPPKTIRQVHSVNDAAAAKKEQTIAMENTFDILHSEILFKY